MEPFISFLGAHHTLPDSSVEVQCCFILKLVEVHARSRPQLVGGASEDVNLLIIKNCVLHTYYLHIVTLPFNRVMTAHHPSTVL